MKLFIALVLWCLLFVLCWPLALLALVDETLESNVAVDDRKFRLKLGGIDGIPRSA